MQKISKTGRRPKGKRKKRKTAIEENLDASGRDLGTGPINGIMFDHPQLCPIRGLPPVLLHLSTSYLD
jgi:hypothetical protein